MNDKTVQIIKDCSQLNRRLSELIKERKMTIHVLAKKAGVAVGTIQKLISDPSCNPTISSIAAICHALDTSISTLIGQEEKMNPQNGLGVYLLDWEELPITFENIQKLTENGLKKREIIKTSCQVSKNAFALKVHDDSMLPLFPENAILIFDPDRSHENNKYVIVQIHQHKNILFKQLLIDEPFKYITSINPLLKENIIKLEQTDKIIAVLVQSQMKY